VLSKNAKETEEDKGLDLVVEEENDVILEVHKPQEIFDCKYLPE